MTKKIEDIANLLPEGMDKSLLTEIAKVMQDLITERVDEEIDILTTKVHGFLRQNKETLQEAALEELAETHEIYRDAQALKDIKSLLAFEVEREDLDPVLEQVSSEMEEVTKNNDTLVHELSESIKETQRLENTVSILEDKIDSLTEKTEQLQESNETLEEELNSDFESTEKAVVITNDVDAPVEDKEDLTLVNPYLTEDVVALMPNSKN